MHVVSPSFTLPPSLSHSFNFPQIMKWLIYATLPHPEAMVTFFSNIIQYHKHLLSTPSCWYLHKRSSTLLSSHARKFPRHPTSSSALLDRCDNLQDQIDVSDHTLVFTMEEAVLKSTSLFPFFMLVAYEAGSPLRALILLALYPLICLLRKEWGLKLMVMAAFLGINKQSFIKMGKSVMPRFFLEDTGFEGLETVRRFKRKVGFSHMPRVMVESFLKDYMEVDRVVGSEIKEFRGYFTGVLMKDVDDNGTGNRIAEVPDVMNLNSLIGICGSRSSIHSPAFSACKEIHFITMAEKTTWSTLPKCNYPKPLIFHDSRLVSKPTPSLAIAVLMWLPFAFLLFLIRSFFLSFVPPKLSRPFLCFSGLRALLSVASWDVDHAMQHLGAKAGVLYVCNHRTLSDPVYLHMTLDNNITALTYSLSKLSELLSPIKTARLTRQRDQDAAMMKKLLSQGNVAVCAEGTTCREPYLLRFSPLFAEISDVIVPVALNTCFTFFYGNTAGGYKFLDPVFFLMDPHPSYTIQLLDRVRGLATCRDRDGAGKATTSKFELANQVQAAIGKALGFECTMLTRKDKYLILAGNDGSGPYVASK